MWCSPENTVFVKEKLSVLKGITVTFKKYLHKGKVETGVPLNGILFEVEKDQGNDFVENENSHEKLCSKSLLVNSSSRNVVGCPKISPTCPTELNNSGFEIIKIRPARGCSSERKYPRFFRKWTSSSEQNSAPEQANDIANCIRQVETELEVRSETDSDICLDQIKEKNYNKRHESIKRNKFSKKQPDNVVNGNVGKSNSRICVIEKVYGNAIATFSSSDDITFPDDDVICLDPKESQVIVPKKTDDITKIKGWRRKQFFVEKPTTVEFSYGDTTCPNILTEECFLKEIDKSLDNHVKNAFVCESLDEFLEQDAKLKIDYEVPHLFAEVGIKLTKEEIASSPSLSEKDIKEVETKYCRQVSNQNDNVDDGKTLKNKKAKRQIEDDNKESFKKTKLENNERFIKEVKKSIEKETNCCNKNSTEQNLQVKIQNGMELNVEDFSEATNVSNIKLTSKILGLVVYPSPNKPLHPIVQFHLQKLRSYRTSIDSNWANFAASVVSCKDSKYKRCIVPASCCVKIIKDSVTSKEKITNVTPMEVASNTTNTALLPAEESSDTEEPEVNQSFFSRVNNKKNFSVEELRRMKDCKVLIKKLDVQAESKLRCQTHSRFNCKICLRVKSQKSILKPIKGKKSEKSVIRKVHESEKPFLRSSEPGFYEELTVLLSKKLKLFHPDSVTSIDSLKTLNTNAVELIKLRFIQKSYLHKYISIWYLKHQRNNVKSRAFLTFSKTPPVPNAINLRHGLFVKNLPKVIREIVRTKKYVDPNEYVLLYCNGDYWEIHGSVNVAFNKSIKSTEQIMIPYELPELKNLQEISYKMLKTKAAKWWVLDITQEFQDIELKSENLVSKISQKKLLAITKHSTSAFMPLRHDLGERAFGVYMVQNLLPYVLIGPYDLFEIRNTSLKEDFSSLPFVYNEIKEPKRTRTLQTQISSVIKKIKESGKKVEGLWLHVRTYSEHSCFLEVMTAIGVNTSFRNNYSIFDEHGYSLSSASVPEVNKKIVESTHSKLQGEVYLYFDVFGLGYVLGVLEEDNTITINHPLNERTKVNSTEIGNWFLGIVRSKIQFIPKNLVVNWFVTKNKSLLRNRQPFNKNFLNGSHILTGSGVFYVLKLTDSIHQEDNRKRLKFLEPANQNAVVEEVLYLRSLSEMLVGRNLKCRPGIGDILRLAVKEIAKLQEEIRLLRRVKQCLEEEKLRLFNSYLSEMDFKDLNKEISLMLLNKIKDLFFSENGKISESYMKSLEAHSSGQHFLKAVAEQKLLELKASSNNLVE